jgi:ABC-type dipeptide/oligopeptide/nickel transport system permease subunit
MAAFCGAALLADYVAPYSYEEQLRELPDSPPSRTFLLGTDELGRDRFSRLLYGARVSLVLAPAASMLAVAIAALLGGLAGSNRIADLLVTGASNLTMSLPWLFLLMGVRAALPLNTTPWVSVTITFALLGILGWAGPAQVVRQGVLELRSSEFVLAARARGIAPGRILISHVLPNLRPVLAAQFWTSLPMLILAEANLGMLGLGVSEPLPSLGNLLRGLETQAAGWDHPFSRYWLFAPILLLSGVLSCLHILFPSGRVASEIRQ